MKRTAILFTMMLGLIALGSGTDAAAQRGPRERPGRLPTVDQMAEATHATPEQRAVLAEALLDMRDAPRGEGGPGANAGENFLLGLAPSFETSQMIALVDLLSESRPGPGAQAGPGPHGRREFGSQGRGHRGQGMRGQGMRGQGMRGQGMREQGHPRGNCDQRQGPAGKGAGRRAGGHAELLQQLDLSPEQMEEIQALNASTRAALMGLRNRVGKGEPTEADLAEAQRLRDAQQARVEEILGAKEWKHLEELRADRRADRAEQAATRAEKRIGERLDQMTTLLDLSDGQASKLEKVLQARQEERSAKQLEHWENGGPVAGLFDGGPRRGDDPEMTQAIREILTPEQRELWSGLQGLRRHAARR